MKSLHRALAIVVAFACVPAWAESPPPSEDWPQFRGVRRDGFVPGSLMRAWPEGGPKIVWKSPLGPAFSQIAVAGELVVTGLSDAEHEYVGAFDRATGREIWRQPLGKTFVQEEFGSGPRGTPTVAAGVVYAFGGSGVLEALALKDGKKLWEIDVTKTLGAEVPRFGFSGSPLVVDDLIVLEVGGSEKRRVAAFDRQSGALRWAALEGPAGYSSPVIAELAGTRQIVLVRGAEVSGLSLSGEELWSHKLEEGAIADPLIVPGDRVFVASNGDTGCVMVRVKKTPEGFQVEELWKNREMRNHFNSSVFVDGHIFGFDNATLKCLSAETGETRWAKRGLGKGSLLIAGDRLVILGDRGLMIVAERSTEAYRELGSVQVVDGSRAWTAPSLAGGRLYVRNLVEMACIDLRG